MTSERIGLTLEETVRINSSFRKDAEMLDSTTNGNSTDLSKDGTKNALRMLFDDNCSILDHPTTDGKKALQPYILEAILAANIKKDVRSMPGMLSF